MAKGRLEHANISVTDPERSAALLTELLGWEDRIGTIKPGKLADLIAVRGNPLEDLSELQRVSFVMSGGQVIRRD